MDQSNAPNGQETPKEECNHEWRYIQNSGDHHRKCQKCKVTETFDLSNHSLPELQEEA